MAEADCTRCGRTGHASRLVAISRSSVAGSGVISEDRTTMGALCPPCIETVEALLGDRGAGG